MKRIQIIVLLALILILGGAFYWLTKDNEVITLKTAYCKRNHGSDLRSETMKSDIQAIKRL